MKEDIHPKVYKAKVSCACGAEFETISTKKQIKVELCSQCHPFYTGEQRLVDSAGRVEKFNRRYGKNDNSK
ncbi:MAG: 50S ribosomal protein L31 [Elusimicrobiota bacterium]